MLSTLESNMMSTYVDEINNGLHLIFNSSITLFPYKRVTMPVNAMFLKNFTYEYKEADLDVVVVIDGSLSNLVRVHSKQLTHIKAGTKIFLADANALLANELNFKPLQITIKNAKLAANLVFWETTENLIEVFIKFFGGQYIQSHWSTKYRRLEITDEEMKMGEHDYFEIKKENNESKEYDFQLYSYNNCSKNAYVYVAMPTHYLLNSVVNIINSYSSSNRCDILELAEEELPHVIKSDEEMGNLWFSKNFGIMAGYNSFLTPSYLEYLDDISTFQNVDVEAIKKLHTITLLMTTMTSLNELKKMMEMMMQLSITPVKVCIHSKTDPMMFDYIKTQIVYKPFNIRAFVRNIMCKPMVFIECVSYCPIVEEALKHYESTTTYFFEKRTINDLFEAAKEAYKNTHEINDTVEKKRKLE